MLSEACQVPAAPALQSAMASRGQARGEKIADRGRGEPAEKKLGGLVLTRHLGESIMIGDEVEILVVGIKSNTARLRIVAPRSVPVHRREVFDALRSMPAPAEAEATPARAPEAPGKPNGGLVLTRSARQSIMVGGEVEVSIVEVRPTTVKLKVSAPRSVMVHRREVFDAIRGDLA